MQKNNRKQEILAKMMQISELINQTKQEESTEVGDILYLDEYVFIDSNLAERGIYIATIKDLEKNINVYEIYSEKTNRLIATVNEQGKLHFTSDYIEALREINPKFVELLNIEGLSFDFELPKELQKDDILLTKEEREHMSSNKKEKTLEKDSNSDKRKEEEDKQEKKKDSKTLEEQKREAIAKKKGIPAHSVLVVKENSNLYKDHPNLEPNLYFYKDKEGIVRAEYLDNNGIAQPSKYFEASTTALRQETVSLGNNGNPVTKEVPYQVMKTKGLNNVDKDIRDVRINVKIDGYGYLSLEEARQGKNGEWLSHDIEVKGRNYNSHEINEETSIKTRKADPDKQTKMYEQTKNTGLKKDGIEYSEMYLVEHAEEIIDGFVDEGYQKREAIDIFNYMIDEPPLTEEDAKEEVNKDIKNGKYKENEELENNGKEQLENEDEGRTPWGDAMAREARKRG